ncbi:Hint domain-containing protein [Ruegeria arenilitoris]|uniref:Hint domain-containing protein n=1 Tax=Ruegeria arenilitoris TaxID=1173585 RepID=UPI0020C58A65|nr:Hint domain-containing protein [Ruegeria arenilitoris]
MPCPLGAAQPPDAIADRGVARLFLPCLHRVPKVIGHPKQDLIVSQQHRILVSSAVAQRMFDRKDVLIPAKKLLSLDAIDIVFDTSNGVEFFHLLFDTHELVWSNGALTESLLTGPEALKSVSAEAYQEILALFPESCDPLFEALSVRYAPKRGKQMLKLVDRHQANKKAAVQLNGIRFIGLS